MSPWLIAICGVIYIVVACDLAYHGKTGLAIAYFGYAFANVGLWWAAHSTHWGHSLPFKAAQGGAANARGDQILRARESRTAAASPDLDARRLRAGLRPA